MSATSEPLDLHVLGGAGRCPFCHDSIDVRALRWVACAACLARHHDVCWAEAPRCASCGGQALVHAPGRDEARLLATRRPAWRGPGLLALTLLGLVAGLAGGAAALRALPPPSDAPLPPPPSLRRGEIAAALDRPTSAERAHALRKLARDPWLTPGERLLVVESAGWVREAPLRAAILRDALQAGGGSALVQRVVLDAALALGDADTQAEPLLALARRPDLAPAVLVQLIPQGHEEAGAARPLLHGPRTHRPRSGRDRGLDRVRDGPLRARLAEELVRR